MTDLRITDSVDEVALAELRERVIAYNLAATGFPDGDLSAATSATPTAS